VAGENVEEDSTVPMPNIHVSIFAATDYEVAVHATKTTADYVSALPLTRVLAGQTPRE
jgi:hypothetical protein